MRPARLIAVAVLALQAGCGNLQPYLGDLTGTYPTGTATATGTSAGASTAAPIQLGAVAQKPTGTVTPMLIFLSGYTSCGTNSSNQFDPTLSPIAPLLTSARQQLQQAGFTNVPWVLGCFGSDPSKIVYLTSAAGGAATTDTVANMIAAAGQLAGSVSNAELFVVGHSYGGWSAMDTVLQLGSTDYVAGLITLDPISTANCTPSGFVNNFISNIANGGTDPGCTQAPTDFGANGLAQIAAASHGFWQNAYETDCSVLHSGPIPNASSNTQRSYPGTQGFDAHNDVLTDPVTSTTIQQALQTLY